MSVDAGNKIIRIYDDNTHFKQLGVDEVIAQGLNQWQGYTCAAGNKNLYIDYDGNVWRCNTASARRTSMIRQSIPVTDVTKLSHKGFLGNIRESIDIPTDWFTCQWKHCACGADVLVPKALPSHINSLMINGPGGQKGLTNDPRKRLSIGNQVAAEPFYPLGKQILWDIGRQCNFECSYCWPGSHNRTDPHVEWDIIVNTSNKLINDWAVDQPIRWYFGGGEPTLHPKFIQWMQWLKEKQQWTLVTSNGSRPAKYWKSIIPYLNAVNLSVHFEYINEDKLMENIQVICEYFAANPDDHCLEIKLMATPLTVNRAIELQSRIKASGLLDLICQENRINASTSLVPIRDMHVAGKIVDYTPEQMILLSNQ